jgi:hypothetical protein
VEYYILGMPGWLHVGDEHNQPSWTRGLFIALACVVAGMARYMVFRKKRRVVRSTEMKTTNSAVIENGEDSS